MADTKHERGTLKTRSNEWKLPPPQPTRYTSTTESSVDDDEPVVEAVNGDRTTTDKAPLKRLRARRKRRDALMMQWVQAQREMLEEQVRFLHLIRESQTSICEMQRRNVMLMSLVASIAERRCARCDDKCYKIIYFWTFFYDICISVGSIQFVGVTSRNCVFI